MDWCDTRDIPKPRNNIWVSNIMLWRTPACVSLETRYLLFLSPSHILNSTHIFSERKTYLVGHLKGKVTEKRGENEKEVFCWFNPHVAATGPDQVAVRRLEPHPSLPDGCRGPGHHFTYFPGHVAESWIGIGRTWTGLRQWLNLHHNASPLLIFSSMWLCSAIFSQIIEKYHFLKESGLKSCFFFILCILPMT